LLLGIEGIAKLSMKMFANYMRAADLTGDVIMPWDTTLNPQKWLWYIWTVWGVCWSWRSLLQSSEFSVVCRVHTDRATSLLKESYFGIQGLWQLCMQSKMGTLWKLLWIKTWVSVFWSESDVWLFL
jgi:hypothetical protein